MLGLSSKQKGCNSSYPKKKESQRLVSDSINMTPSNKAPTNAPPTSSSLPSTPSPKASTTIKVDKKNLVTIPARPTKPKGNEGRWKRDEHNLFLQGLARYGRGQWKKIAKDIPTRTVWQVRTHAQKYYLKIFKAQQKELRIAQGLEPAPTGRKKAKTQSPPAMDETSLLCPTTTVKPYYPATVSEKTKFTTLSPTVMRQSPPVGPTMDEALRIILHPDAPYDARTVITARDLGNPRVVKKRRPPPVVVPEKKASPPPVAVSPPPVAKKPISSTPPPPTIITARDLGLDPSVARRMLTKQGTPPTVITPDKVIISKKRKVIPFAVPSRGDENVGPSEAIVRIVQPRAHPSPKRVKPTPSPPPPVVKKVRPTPPPNKVKRGPGRPPSTEKPTVFPSIEYKPKQKAADARKRPALATIPSPKLSPPRPPPTRAIGERKSKRQRKVRTKESLGDLHDHRRQTWKPEEDAILQREMKNGKTFYEIAQLLPLRSEEACAARYYFKYSPKAHLSNASRV